MKFHRKAFLAGVVIVAAAALGCNGSRSDRPNVLIITLDTVRADHLSCYGYARPTSPRLDQLAEEGDLFESFINVSSWTLPSHASLFTGLFPSTHGARYSDTAEASLSDAIGQEGMFKLFRANALPDSAVTLAEVLRESGYVTGGVGAGPWLKPAFGLADGFDEYDSETNSTKGRPAEEVNRLALSFLKSHGNEPFFLFVNYFDAHDPYTPNEELRFEFFDEERVPLIRNDPGVASEFELSQYDAEILHVDRHIAVLLERLKRLGVYDNTWIIVVSDHGEAFGEHELVLHGFSLFEPEVRGVFIQKSPAGWGRVEDTTERCQQVDIMPTILERLEIEHDLIMEGQPLGSIDHPPVAELFRNEGNIRWKGERFDRDLKAIYSGRYKLIQSTRGSDRDAGMFDLVSDPGESIDISEQLPDERNSLLGALAQWEASLADPLLARPAPAVDQETLEQLKSLGYLH